MSGMWARSAYQLVPSICDWAARNGMRIDVTTQYDPIGDQHVLVFRHDKFGEPAHYIELGSMLAGFIDESTIKQIKATIRITQP